VSTVQVPKQGRDLRRESAFCVAPVAQVSALKWNLHHLWLNLSHLRLNLRRLSLNLRHRGASGFFRNSPQW
jgi:DNA mismatch repair protein MutH